MVPVTAGGVGKVSNWTFNLPKGMWNFFQKLVLDLNSSCILHKACAMWASMLYSHSPPLFVLKLKVKFDFPQLASFHNGDLEGKFSKVQQSCRCDEMAVKQLF